MADFFLPFDENSPLNRKIYEKMRLWEKFIVRFFSFFRKDFLPDYYSNIGLRQLEKELAAHSTGWYNADSKELTAAFATDLHSFLKTLACIAPILKDTIGSPALREKSQSSKVPLIEKVFSALRSETPEDYPFGERSVFKLVNNIPIRDVDVIMRRAVNDYFAALTAEDINEINGRYSRFVTMDRALSMASMDFLRRFNLNVNLIDSFSWDSLALAASAYYLENFFQTIEALDIREEDFPFLLKLQEIRAHYNPDTEILSQDVLRDAWNKIAAYTSLFRSGAGIQNLLRLAHRSLSYHSENTAVQFILYDKFRDALDERLQAVVQNITRNSLKQEMKQLVQDILPSSIYSQDLTDVGVFTAGNSDRIQAAINESLRNVYAMSLLQVFIVKFYKPWVKNFLGSCAINAQFNQSNVRVQLNSTYKNLNKLTESFDKFAVDVHPKSSMGLRVAKLLDNPKMNRSDKHLLKVFADSLNNQADQLVAAFYSNFPNLFWFIDSITADLDNKTTGFVSNLVSVKALLDPELPPRLHDLRSFSASVMDLLNIAFPKDKTEHSQIKTAVLAE